MKVPSLVAVTLACAAFSAAPAAAQPGSDPVRSDTRGLGVGVQLNGGGVSSHADDSRMAPGAGMGLTVSYGMSDALSVFGRANMGYRTSQLDVGARYRFGSAAGALRPYVEGAVTRLGAIRGPQDGSEQSLRSWGLGATVGAGVEYYFSPRFAVDVGLAHTRGRFSEPALPGEAAFGDKFSSTRVQLGVTWRP
jgi:opacity protein-like surface antigen